MPPTTTAARSRQVRARDNRPTLERLATYLRYLIDLEQNNVETISSAEVETETGVNAAQFRKDLSYFGEFGKPGVGYNVLDLQNRIARILKINQEQRVLLVGAGNLGSALVGYPGLKEHKFNLVAVFDNNYAKIGRYLWDLEILDIGRLKEVNAKLRARMGIVAVPRPAAQNVADALIDADVHVANAATRRAAGKNYEDAHRDHERDGTWHRPRP